MNASQKKLWIIQDKSDKCVLAYDENDCSYRWFESTDLDIDDVKTFDTKSAAEQYINVNFSDIRSEWSTVERKNLAPIRVGDLSGDDDGPDELAVPGWLARVKQTATKGANLGVGMQAAKLVHTHAMAALKKAKVPSFVLNHRAFSGAVMIGAPLVLSVLAPVVADRLKIPHVVLARIDDAATAAIAMTVDELADLAGAHLKPLIKELEKLRG